MARILIVDDEPLIALMVEEWLSELEHAVVGPAHDLDGALAAAEREHPDAAVLDLTLGAHDSYPVALRLRARAIPFAFASGHGRDVLIPEFRDALLLNKPFAFETFRNLIGVLLGQSAGRDPARR
jgi:DNA-binding response OmpR family regulator